MTSNVEIAGLILIIVGVMYTFLKALGKFSNKEREEGEIESKMLTVKGGPGIILVGLGVFLLIIGYVGGEKTEAPSGNVQTLGLTNTDKEITTDYLFGKWSKSDKNFAYTFYPDNNFLFEENGGSLSQGKYSLANSNIQLSYDTGEKYTYPLSYIDEYTVKIGDAVYVWETPADNKVTYDYLTGKWSKNDNNFAITFYSDGTFLFEDLTDSSSFEGAYELTGSKVEFTFSSGEKDSYPVSYIDDYTVKLGDGIFELVQPVQTTIATTGYTKITLDYLEGNWSAVTTSYLDVILFYRDGTFGEATKYSDTGKIESAAGTYDLVNSKLILRYDTGTQTYPLAYIDWNTMQVGDVEYSRMD